MGPQTIFWAFGAVVLSTVLAACNRSSSAERERAVAKAPEPLQSQPIGSSADQRVVFCGVVGGKHNLYIINVDGTALHQLTESPAEDQNPTWSPDGSIIVFTRVPGHKPDEVRSDANLWVVRPDGTALRQLTSGPFYDADVSWRADGKAISFYRQGEKPGVYKIDLDGTHLEAVASMFTDSGHSPNGKWWAAIRSTTEGEDEHRGDLWLSDSQGRNGRQLTKFESSMYAPVWSPDSKQLFLLVEQGEDMPFWSVSVPDGKLTLLLQGKKSYFEHPVWSPDAKRIAFLQSLQEESMTNSSFRQLYVMDPDGKNVERLTDHWGDDYTPQWTRDGKSIVVQGERGMTHHASGGVSGQPKSCIVVVDASGKGERVLPVPHAAYNLSLSP